MARASTGTGRREHIERLSQAACEAQVPAIRRRMRDPHPETFRSREHCHRRKIADQTAPTIQAMVAQSLGVSLVPSLSVKNLRGCRAIPLKPRAFRRIGMLSSCVLVSTSAIDMWRKLVRSRIAYHLGS